MALSNNSRGSVGYKTINQNPLPMKKDELLKISPSNNQSSMFRGGGTNNTPMLPMSGRPPHAIGQQDSSATTAASPGGLPPFDIKEIAAPKKITPPIPEGLEKDYSFIKPKMEIVKQTPPTFEQSIYRDLVSQHEGDWKNQEDIVRAQTAAEGRRAAEMAASLGAAAGGGTFAAGQAQAGLKGQELMMTARQEHDIRGLELKMTYLLNQLKSAEAAKDRNLQEKLQTMINTVALTIEGIRAGATPNINYDRSDNPLYEQEKPGFVDRMKDTVAG